MYVASRNMATFEAVRNLLTPEHFDQPGERKLAIMWSSVLEFHERHGCLPNQTEIFTEVEGRLEADYASFSDAEIDDINRLLNTCFEIPAEELRDGPARSWCSQLLMEHVNAQTRDALRGDVVVDLPGLLQEQVDIANQAASLDVRSSSLPFDVGSLEELARRPPITETISTGCYFLDPFMNGGQAKGEVYGVIAPYATGKTLLGVQLAVNRAKYERDTWVAGGCQGHPPLTYVVAWEEEKSSLQVRLLSCWGSVDRKLIEAGGFEQTASRTANQESLKDYERAYFRDLLEREQPVAGEWERLTEAFAGIQRYIRIIDFTGTDSGYSAWSADGARGVAAAIAADQANNEGCANPGVSMVVCDHANAMAERAIQYHGYASAEKRHLVGNFPMGMKNNLAIPYECPVWVMHQMKAAAQTKGLTGGLPQINDSAEAQNFGEYLNFMFAIGAKNYNDLCILVATKQRRAEKQPPTVIRLDGMLCTMRSTGTSYRIDNGRIVSAHDLNRYVTELNEEVDFVDESGAGY